MDLVYASNVGHQEPTSVLSLVRIPYMYGSQLRSPHRNSVLLQHPRITASILIPISAPEALALALAIVEFGMSRTFDTQIRNYGYHLYLT